MHENATSLHKSPETLLAGEWTAPQGKDFPPHQHTVWEVVYYRSGHIRCPVGDAVYIGQPGIILATPPGVVHAEIALTEYSNFYAQIAASPNMRWPILSYDDGAGTLRNLFEALVRESRGRAEKKSAMIALLTAQLDIHLRRAADREGPAPSEAERIVRQAERLLEEQITESVRLTELAHSVGVSPSTLRAYFTTLRGYSPRAALQTIRARRAVALLRTSDLTLDAVAHLTGYDSASHLSRHIRRITGQPPGAQRRPIDGD